jgi:hypothetical protein
MNQLPEVRDRLGHFHNRSPLITSNRNSDFERRWCVIRQADYTISKLLTEWSELSVLAPRTFPCRLQRRGLREMLYIPARFAFPSHRTLLFGPSDLI